MLVTGATGFLGGAVCAELRAAGGWEITATGRNAEKGARIPADHFVPADLAKPGGAVTLARGHDAVVHCAALTSPWGRPAEFERANIIATAALLDAAISAGVRRFVHVSTPSIYGEHVHRENLTEKSPLPARPINEYARTKLAAERLVLAARDRIEVVVLRPHALIGVGDTTLLPRLVRAASHGKLRIIGDGRARTDLTCVENAALACRLALEADAAHVAGEAFNITNGEPTRLWDSLGQFLADAGLPTPRGRVPFALVWTGAALAEAWARYVSGKEPVLTRYGAGVLAFSQTFDIDKARRLPRLPPDAAAHGGTLARGPLVARTTGGGCGRRTLQTMTPLLETHFWAIGSCRGPGAVAERGRGWRMQTFPALAVALRHPAHGWTLYDTGYDPRYLEWLRDWTHRPIRWALPVELPPEQRLEQRLSGIGLHADDFRRVVVSHFHLDHISGLHLFQRADLVFSKDAWQSVENLSGWQAARAIYHPAAVDRAQIAARGRMLDNADARPWNGFPITWDLFGDGSLRLVSLPGHARGQLGAVFRRAPDGREIFLVSDACWTRGNLRGRPPGKPARFLMHDPAAFDETLRRLEKFTSAHPDTLLVPSHCAKSVADLQATTKKSSPL